MYVWLFILFYMCTVYTVYVCPIQDKCNSQAVSIQELEAKLEEEGAQKRELKRQLDEKAEMCRQIEVRTFLFCHNIKYRVA